MKMNARFRFIALVTILGGMVSLPATTNAADPQPQPQAHAHNDYEHDRPLLDALDHGFCSVEADVYAIDGELRVAHDRIKTKAGKTLEKLYLDPLLARVKQNGGRVFKDGPPFSLLIDFKTAGAPTYALLRKTLANYRSMLVAKSADEPAAISIVISGNRPFDIVDADADRLCGLDGRLSDLDSKRTGSLMPMISDNWKNYFKWRGEGEISADELAKLREAVAKSHAAGRRIRFWATPENEKMWTVLQEAGVDHINTDQLARLQAFLLKQPVTP